MKVYVIYDPLLEEVICVHQIPNIECDICKPVRENRKKENSIYFLEEIEKEVMNPEYNNLDMDFNADKKRREKNQESIKYYNPKSENMEELFDKLNTVYTVCYQNHEVGWKGEALYITLEAENQEQAKNIAMLNPEFTEHIDIKYFNRKCLSAFKPKGNYVIGKVEYYEGDERL